MCYGFLSIWNNDLLSDHLKGSQEVKRCSQQMEKNKDFPNKTNFSRIWDFSSKKYLT